MTRPECVISLPDDDRFDRLRRIEWWDQERLSRARVLVVGAGALGNEIVKNLALLGIGHILIADFDAIEYSNLSRSILFRQADTGRPKARVAAEAAKAIYPDAHVGWFHGDVIYELGLGVFRWANVIIAGLDSREARLHVNRACYLVSRPFVDAATEILRGVVRVFLPPGTACYECTMSTADWEALDERRGCAGMRAEGVAADRVPTTSVTASVIGAIQCQEALKILHGLPGLAGEGLVFDGMANDLYRVRYSRNEDCNSHEAFDNVVSLSASVRTTAAGGLLEEARRRLGEDAVLQLRHEMLESLYCTSCGTTEKVWRPLANVAESRAGCPSCGEVRQPTTVRVIHRTSSCLDRILGEMGLPLFEIVGARNGLTVIGFEFSADAAAVLGEAVGYAEPSIGGKHAAEYC
jgi:molybdopterin/thiamine biosynthesis adenylyltransferase